MIRQVSLTYDTRRSAAALRTAVAGEPDRRGCRNKRGAPAGRIRAPRDVREGGTGACPQGSDLPRAWWDSGGSRESGRVVVCRPEPVARGIGRSSSGVPSPSAPRHESSSGEDSRALVQLAGGVASTCSSRLRCRISAGIESPCRSRLAITCSSTPTAQATRSSVRWMAAEYLCGIGRHMTGGPGLLDAIRADIGGNGPHRAPEDDVTLLTATLFDDPTPFTRVVVSGLLAWLAIPAYLAIISPSPCSAHAER